MCHPEPRRRGRTRTLSVGLLFAFLVACAAKQAPLPELYPVPNANLIDENGKPVNLDSMKGHVTVYDFIFTSCAGICPIMSNSMRRLTEKVPQGARVRFVSITVDPTRDTPEVLRKYAQRYRNDDRWVFLTGDRDTIIDLSVKGFKLAAGDPSPGGDPLLHSSKFAIADKNGVIREYYGGTDGDAPDHVSASVQTLLSE
jgi:protein SCO1